MKTYDIPHIKIFFTINGKDVYLFICTLDIDDVDEPKSIFPNSHTDPDITLHTYRFCLLGTYYL